MLVEAAWAAAKAPGPLHAFFVRIRARRGHQVAAVATARKLAVLVWHLLTKEADYLWARPALVAHKLRALELQAGRPMKKGNQRGPAYAYNVKALRDQEMAIAEQAERAYEHFVAQWRPRSPARTAHGRRKRGRVIVIRRPGEASSRRPALRHAVARAASSIAPPSPESLAGFGRVGADLRVVLDRRDQVGACLRQTFGGRCGTRPPDRPPRTKPLSSSSVTGASIEQTLDLWAAELGAVKAQIQPLFNHASVAASAGAFLDGVLGPERRKTGWMRAEAAGDPGPWRQQAVLGRSRWDAEALRDLVRDYALETLAAPDAMLVIDETGFLKQGSSSCGVQRQYTGSAGKITNCQIGVFAAYVSAKGHAFIDRRLYLPKSWTGQPDRRCAAHVPDDIHFATKPAIAVAMIERALNAGVAFAWVAADSIYGVGEVEKVLRQAGKGYVLGVTGTHPFWSWGKAPVVGTAEEIAQRLPATAWAGLSAGDGTKGPRLYDWAYLELADLDAEEVGCPVLGTWTRGLLIRRSLSDASLAYFTTWCPTGTPLDVLVGVEGRRWAIEDAFETAKTELGLDHNETRSTAPLL